MTEAELQDLERLTDAATNGPWVHVDNGDQYQEIWNYCGEQECEADTEAEWCACECISQGIDSGAADAAFIAAARDAVPALVAEVRRLKEANDTAYQRGFDAGAAQLSRALKEGGA